jgi:hypothetical protein
MAQAANVRLVVGSSYRARGYEFNKKGDTKMITNAGDIAYFAACSSFKVSMIKAKPAVAAAASPARAPAAAPEPAEAKPEGPLPWKVGMKKKELIASAESRGIAVSENDKLPEIIQLLKEWDEQQGK